MPPLLNCTSTLLLLTVLLVLVPTETYAFGAGDIPDFAYLNDKAFRHGDIESILEGLVKNVGNAAIGGDSLMGFATSVFKAATGSSKFSKSDIKKVYFGNWLRDYSQAMDIAGLSKLSGDTIILILSILGFMTFGYATEEFEITADRLGVYLPVEHIDNPKGYAEKEGDARQYNAKLRPPVDPRELEIDQNTGMKNYMATENRGWDTSTAFIRRTLKACIEHGRQAGGQENAHLWEAYRLLGTGLHTLEDLLAHSNWCEIALRKMGHEEVFCHVGDNVIVNTPSGQAPALVTGTFGGADFLHSLLGEAGDKLSQASVTDLSNKMNQASQGGNTNLDKLKDILSKLPSGGSNDKLNESEQIHQQSQAYKFDPNNIAPPEVQERLIDLLKWRDNVMRDITRNIEMVPGLSNLLEEFTNAINAYVYTILAPYVVPMITQVSGVLDEGSKVVINNSDQYEVFDNPDASDPSHSLLSKDHFGLILNEPAGKIAQVIVRHTVTLIVRAWSDDSNPDSVLDAILEAFHHPHYATGNSEIQRQMFQEMDKWLGALGSDEARQVIEALTKENVRNHKNKRIGSEDMNFEEPGYGGCSHGHSGGGSSYKPKPQISQQSYGSSGGLYGGQNTYGNKQHSGRTEESNRYGNEKSTYGGRTQESYGGSTYGSGQDNSGGGEGRNRYETESKTYGGHIQESNHYENESNAYGGRTQGGYGGSTHGSGEFNSGQKKESNRYGIESNTYGGRTQESYGGNEQYGSGRHGESNRIGDESSKYEGRTQESYGGRTTQGSEQYNPGRRGESNRYDDDESNKYEGRKQSEERYGGGRYGQKTNTDDNYGSSYERQGQQQSYGGGYQQDNIQSYDGRYGQEDNQGTYGRNHQQETNYSRQSEEKSSQRKSSDDNDQRRGYTPSYGQLGHREEQRSRGSEGYGEQRTRGGGYGGERSGYNPSYGSDETFGAERLKVHDGSDNDSDDSKRKNKQSKRHRRKDSDD